MSLKKTGEWLWRGWEISFLFEPNFSKNNEMDGVKYTKNFSFRNAWQIRNLTFDEALLLLN